MSNYIAYIDADKRFYRYHLWLPVAIFISLVVLLELTQWDLVIADFLYQLEGGEWVMRYHWLTAKMVHDGGRKLVALLVIVTLCLLAGSFFTARLRNYRRGLVFLLISVAIASSIIGFGKQFTHVDCPWDLIRYGGTKQYVPIFSLHPDADGYGKCFPSGHAGGGFAWLALYFFSLRYALRWRWAALAAGIVLGTLFGLAQQARGAHFFSHDIWALAICWFTALGVYIVMLKEPASAPATDPPTDT